MTSLLFKSKLTQDLRITIKWKCYNVSINSLCRWTATKNYTRENPNNISITKF